MAEYSRSNPVHHLFLNGTISFNVERTVSALKARRSQIMDRCRCVDFVERLYGVRDKVCPKIYRGIVVMLLHRIESVGFVFCRDFSRNYSDAYNIHDEGPNYIEDKTTKCLLEFFRLPLDNGKLWFCCSIHISFDNIITLRDP